MLPQQTLFKDATCKNFGSKRSKLTTMKIKPVQPYVKEVYVLCCRDIY